MATASKCAKNSKKRASLRESKLGAKLVCWFGARVGLTVREKKWEVSERERGNFPKEQLREGSEMKEKKNIKKRMKELQ